MVRLKPAYQNKMHMIGIKNLSCFLSINIKADSININKGNVPLTLKSKSIFFKQILTNGLNHNKYH